eukprot:gene12222-15353_t
MSQAVLIKWNTLLAGTNISNSLRENGSSNRGASSIQTQTQEPAGANRIQAIVHEKPIQSLWAGYGQVYSLQAEMEDGTKRNLIAKQVIHPKVSGIMLTAAPASGVGHERKLKSYQVEAAFYSSHASQLLQPPTSLALPQPVFIHADGESFTFVLTDLCDVGLYPVSVRGSYTIALPEPVLLHADGESFTFVLTDLCDVGLYPVSVKGSYTIGQMQVALTWLSRFHSHFWEREYGLEDLWLCGSFWHLATRQAELLKIGDEWSELKAVASRVDKLLRGRSYGARDVARLLTSAGNAEYLEDPATEEALLKHYYSQLMHHLEARVQAESAQASDTSTPHQPSSINTELSFETFIQQYEWALVDYVRYMAGIHPWIWRLDSWGIDRTPVVSYLRKYNQQEKHTF